MTAPELARILESIDLKKKPEITLIVDGLAVVVKLASFIEPTAAVVGAEHDGSDLFELQGTIRLHDKPFTVGSLFADPSHISAIAVEQHAH